MDISVEGFYDEKLRARIREIVADIPAGKIATYGDVATVSGAPSAQVVGQILGEVGHDLPWHRVLRADGTPPAHLAEEQLRRLSAEGVPSDGQRINLRFYRWQAEGNSEPEVGLW